VVPFGRGLPNRILISIIAGLASPTLEILMTSIKLEVPYHSQWDADAVDHFADCGPTSLSMLLAALKDVISPDQLYKFIGPRGASEYTSFTDLINAAKARGLAMTRVKFSPDQAIEGLKALIKAATPVIALVNYAFWDPIVHNGFKASHFVLVTGFDDQNIYIHDPLFKGTRREQGKYCAYTYQQFLDGWNGFAPGVNPNCAGIVSTRPVPFLSLDGVTPKPQPPAPAPTTPKLPVLNDLLRRRIRAKAAFEGLPDPNLDDPVLVSALLAGLGNWGTTADSYTLARGDSLTKIATMFYGNRDKWPVIVYYNNIPHPSLIAPGEVYQIPRPEITPATDGKVPLPGHGGPIG